MMPTSPRSPYHSVRRVFPSTAGRLACQAGPSRIVRGLSLLPAYACCRPVCRRPSCTSGSERLPRTAPGLRPDDAPPWRVGRPPPQGPSLGSGLCCPGPSSLNRPHPPHSQAHRDFTAWRLIRDAFAVRERRGDPRVVPGFRYHSVLTCRPLRPRGVRTSHVSSCAMPTRPSPRSERLGTPNNPAIRFTRGTSFEASLVRVCYGLSGCSPPWTDLTGFPQSPGAFTSRLPTGRSPFPSLDMTTTATGLLCWRNFHPQEWQLASLHTRSQERLGPLPAAVGDRNA